MFGELFIIIVTLVVLINNDGSDVDLTVRADLSEVDVNGAHNVRRLNENILNADYI